jgi:hypothetical protein
METSNLVLRQFAFSASPLMDLLNVFVQQEFTAEIEFLRGVAGHIWKN